MFAPKRILVPTDFSDDSDEALSEALELAKQYHSKVFLLHVAKPITQCAADYCLDASAVKQAEDDEMSRARDRMKRELDKFPEIEQVEIISDIREGDTVSEILKEQNERGVDLIVLPSSHRKNFLERFMAPIYEKVMEASKSPILLVRH